MADLPSQFIAAAQKILGKGGWISDPDLLMPYLSEWRDRWHGYTPFAARPKTSRELSELVALCAKHKVAITTQGGNTGLVGGQIPQGEVLVLTSRLRAVRGVDVSAMTITVEAGLSLQHVANEAAKHRLLFPMQLASSDSATIGGAIATNAGGMGVVRYGTMRNLVLGLEVVSADGKVLNGLSGLVKNNTGLDLKQLFIGSEGSLGIISAATLRLFPTPALAQIVWCSVSSPQSALDLFQFLREQVGDQISKFELISDFALSLSLANTRPPLSGFAPWHVLIEFGLSDPDNGQPIVQHAMEQALEKNLILDAVLAKSEREAQHLLGLREDISAAQKPQGPAAKHDISLPLSNIPDFLQQAKTSLHANFEPARICVFGHLGDGNLHYNVILPQNLSETDIENQRRQITRLVHDLVQKMDGSFSAEHGIGIAKIDDMKRYKSAVELQLIRQIKQALDPDNLMNPRLVLPKDI